MNYSSPKGNVGSGFSGYIVIKDSHGKTVGEHSLYVLP